MDIWILASPLELPRQFESGRVADPEILARWFAEESPDTILFFAELTPL